MGNQPEIKKKKSSEGFQFKQFYVAHNRCAMKVGTDGVLLGAWCPLPSNTSMRILDIGTGSGLIALMLAQRSTLSKIDAIDIDPDAIRQANENFDASPWADRISGKLIRLQEMTTAPLYDVIVSNPPYFVNSLKNPNEGRQTARHTDTLSYADLISFGNILLKESGLIALILPFEAKDEIMKLAEKNHLQTTRITNVYSRPGKPAKRILLTLEKQTKIAKTLICEDFYIESNTGPRSKEYAELTKDFYL